jgi:indolepyruvate ferredoxin oxidoreductase beta subunit
MTDARPLTLLIAALGGEGGGVLADWIVECALAQGLPVQATSVPGVAQRTGSTSYYIEMMRTPAPEGAQPVFALNPMPGGVDVVLASELVEAGRMIERGFVHPKRATLIAATHRVYTTQEKMQMGDGRFDDERIHAGARALAARYLSVDMAGLAAAHGTVISAVMFGALAGAGVLPWSREVCEQVIREGGLGVQASLAGFGAAFDAVADGSAREALAGAGAGLAARSSPEVWAPLLATLPAPMRENAAHGVVRVLDYQDSAYGRLYVERLQRIAAAAGNASTQPLVARALAEAARLLALWMTYEDVIRVADLKSRRSRVARIRDEARARDGEILEIVEYLKPGVDEVAAVLPRALGARLRDWAARSGKLESLNRGMHLPSTRIHGYLMLRLLARLRPMRRRSLRFHEEQQSIERWLAALERMLAASPAFAAALAELPRVLKGYGDTQRRGRASFERIFGTLVERALGSESGPAAGAAQELRAAIEAALAEPEGRELERSLEKAGIEPRAPAAKPIVWMKKPRGAASTVVTSR